MTTDRTYEVIVWGATGFTGRLVAEHAATCYQTGSHPLRWAIAGRNAAKLEDVKQELIALNPACKDVPVLTADISDPASLDKLMGSTEVVVAMAGPYTRLGTPIVEAALRQGTHYVDVTGETLWVRANIDKYHEQAESRKVKIVSMCGFEACPSDLSTLMMVDHIKQTLGKKTARVVQLVKVSPNASFSGGTVATIMMVLGSGADAKKKSLNPYLLTPAGLPRSSGNKTGFAVSWQKGAKKWTSPWLLGLGNAQLVRRSAALRGYGDKFSYGEACVHSTLVAAVRNALFTAFMAVSLSLPPTRFLLARILPKPGEGPSRMAMMNSPWKQTIMATTQEEGGAEPQTVWGEVSAKQDVGYYLTARMVLEAALCLARQGSECEKAGCARGGVLTTATAMGQPLITRLLSAGFDFRVLPSVPQ